ncbi:protein kinase domain-containing protein [Colletotrichum scovillei]|uniref:Protein kinase domain-containing protein n=1 Tax=Colletotrichum scovillei TaxID=1209932 RepID=A0A9P7QZ74_9PEZI|nr:protein kinase domain-containing protein [Colletotrichum scovillei]KAG7056407.1 protein kinase domain-containing protein [Colletotrichum scovillei]KAG7066337.1 protein kinase domain-containing protein [Colletotrichum scovillei]
MGLIWDLFHLNRESKSAIIKYIKAAVAEQQMWLAHSTKTGKKVAVKICASKSESSSTGDEMRISRMLRDDSSHPGHRVIGYYNDIFLHHGPNGTHECLVSEPTRATIAESKFRGFVFPTEIARALAAQLVLGVAYIHSKHIVHGDLHGGNVMLAMPAGEFACLTVKEIYEKYGKPIILPMDLCVEATDFHEEYPLPKNAPPYMLWKMFLTQDCDDLELSEARAQIKDFGESWQPELVTRYELNTPEPYRAPESMIAKKLQLPISYPADVWALGCFIFELYGRMDIFGTYVPGYNSVFATMVHCMGKPPASWWDAWEKRDKHIDDNCNYVRNGKSDPTPAEPDTIKRRVLELIPDQRAMDRFPEEKTFVPEEELQDLAAMLMRIFRWEPEDRVTAEELISDPWMQKWGIPAKEAMEVAYEKRRKEHEKPPLLSKSVAVGLAVGAFDRLAYILSLLSPTSWWRNLKWALGA